MKIKLKGRHFDNIKMINAASQAVLNTLTEHDFKDKLKNLNSVAQVCKRTIILTERPQLVSEISANFSGHRGVTWSAGRIPTAVFSDF
jgi:hypothetical protein